MSSNQKWIDLRKLQPVSEWLQKVGKSEQSFLKKALRSRTGLKMGLASKIQRFIEQSSEPNSIMSIFDQLFQNYGKDSTDVAVFCKNALHHLSMSLAPQVNKLVPVKTPSPPRPDILEYTPPPPKQDIDTGEKALQQLPTALARLNGANQNANPAVPHPSGPTDPDADGNTKPNAMNDADWKKQVESSFQKDQNGASKPREMSIQDWMNHLNKQKASQDENTEQGILNEQDNAPGKATLRSAYKEVTEADIAQTPQEKVQNDVLFDLFSYVPPGFGNGVDNKLYRMDINHCRQIKWAEPMYKLRPYDGPEMGIAPLPYQFKNVMNKDQIEKSSEFYRNNLVHNIKGKSMHIIDSALPGEFRSIASSKGLYSKSGVFEKQIDLRTPFQSMVNPAGSILSKNEMFRLFDPLTSFQPGKYLRQRNSIPLTKALQSNLGNNWCE